LKFYIAAFVGERDRVKEIQRRLRDAGHEITVDWASSQGVPETGRDQSPERVQEIAIRDLNGVRVCDAFILLAEPEDGRAKYVELGVAIQEHLERGKPKIYVLGEKTSQSIFFYHPVVKRVRTLDEILKGVEQRGHKHA